MVDYVKALKWPVITWIVLDLLFIVVSPIKGVSEMFSNDVSALYGLVFGLWVGYTMITQFKGTYGQAFVGGLIIGLVCLVLCIIGFGIVLKMGVAGALPIAIFMAMMNLSGALIGAGFALTK